MRNTTTRRTDGGVQDTDWRLGLLWPPSPAMQERNLLHPRRLSRQRRCLGHSILSTLQEGDWVIGDRQVPAACYHWRRR